MRVQKDRCQRSFLASVQSYQSLLKHQVTSLNKFSFRNMTTDNHVHNVAVIGVGGRVGSFITHALIAQGKHKVTAITRPESKSEMPTGLHEIRKVDYNDNSALVEAMKGQEVLIITMSVMAGRDNSAKLINAASEAGVKWVIPNEYGTDNTNESIGNDTKLGPPLRANRELIESKGNLNWISIACSFWYEFSLSGTEARYGFDFKEKKLTLFDDGKTHILHSTWPQVGRGVAKLLALPIEDSNGLCLNHFKNKSLYISSFRLNQREILESVLRVTKDKETDWTITHEDVKERFQRGCKMLQEGNMIGFGILLYSRVFFPDGAADYSSKLHNKELGLPEENLDEYTKIAIEMAEKGEDFYNVGR